MKIKTRKVLLDGYKEKYDKIEEDPEKRIMKYFRDNKLNPNKTLKKSKELLEKILDQREYQHIKITFYEYPMKTDRSRHSGGRAWSPNAALNKKYLKDAIKATRKIIKKINTPAEYLQKTYLEMPKNIPPEEVVLYEVGILRPVDTPDWDNTGKCYSDMSTDNLIIDDDIFYDGHVKKFYSLLPRVELVITFLKHHESKYIFRKMKTRKTIKEAMKIGLVDLNFIK